LGASSLSALSSASGDTVRAITGESLCALCVAGEALLRVVPIIIVIIIAVKFKHLVLALSSFYLRDDHLTAVSIRISSSSKRPREY
jgi:hypothetical protein